MKTHHSTSNEVLVHATCPVFYYQTWNRDAIWRESNENETLWTNYKGRVWSTKNIYFLLIFVMCFPKFRESFNVSPNRFTLSTSGEATPSANSDNLTLGFCERTSAVHFSGFKIILLLRNHSHTTIENMFDNSWISISKIHHQHSQTASPRRWKKISHLWKY